MAGLPSEVDVAVIGAGAAGIAAGRRLAEAKHASFVVIEARERAGGRAWTVEREGLPLDLGCEWLHSADRNLLAPIAERLGFSIYRRRPDWMTRLHRSGATPEAEADWLSEHEAFYWAVHRAAQGAEDVAASTVLVPGGRWNALLDATSTWVNAVELDCVSCRDIDRYEDSGVNWRLREGYGKLFGALADGLPIAYGTPVARVAHGGRPIRLETAGGTLRAARIVVTVPTDIIAGEHLVFDPPLPDKVAAASGLPLGLADKLFLHIDDALPDAEEELFLIGSTQRR